MNIWLDILKEFAIALITDFFVLGGHIKSGSERSKASAAGTAAGSLLRPHLFGLSRDDEAAFLEALAELNDQEMTIIVERMEALGTAGKIDTAEARAFRMTIVTMENTEVRKRVLQSLAEADEEVFVKIVRLTGAAQAGRVNEVFRFLKDEGLQRIIDLPAGWQRADEQAAERVSVFGNWLRRKTDALRRGENANNDDILSL